MWKTKSNLKKEIVNYFLLFSLFTLVLLWLFQAIFFKTFYKEQKRNDVKSIANKLKRIQVDSNFTDYLNDLALDKSACIEMNNADYTAIYTASYFGKDCIPNSQITYQYKYDFISSNKKEKQYLIINPKSKKETLVYALKKQDNQYIFINTSLEPIDDTQKLIQKELIVITILIILSSYIIAYIISSHISRPIKDMSEQAKKLAKGNFSIEFDETSNIEEIEELSKTLNYTKEELSRIEELRRDLMANVSHDLKTPLTMIKATAEIAKDLHQNDSLKQEEDMNTIIKETDRLTLLVNDILELSKAETISEKLVIEEFDLIVLIDEILKQYKILTETEKYNFIFEHKDQELLVKADKKKLEQVIHNLLNNAINYTGEDNKVTIRVTKEKKNIKVEIIDTGNGIKEEDIPYIWNKYYKSEKKHKRNLIGTGLGLNIVKNILEQHHFLYGVKSSPKGSTFYFVIKEKKK